MGNNRRQEFLWFKEAEAYSAYIKWCRGILCKGYKSRTFENIVMKKQNQVMSADYCT